MISLFWGFHIVLCFKDFFHLVCILLICWVLQKLCLTSRSYLMITTLWHPPSCSVSSYFLSLSFNLGLEPKVPDCARFQYMKLAFNPRSILLNPCVNDLSLTQYGLPFNFVVVVVIELRQQRTFPSTSYGRCSFMEPNGSRQEFFVWLSSLCPWLFHTLPFSISLHEMLTCASTSKDSF
jgi:hypothetical protein